MMSSWVRHMADSLDFPQKNSMIYGSAGELSKIVSFLVNESDEKIKVSWWYHLAITSKLLCVSHQVFTKYFLLNKNIISFQQCNKLDGQRF